MNTELFEMVNRNHELVTGRNSRVHEWIIEEKEDKYRGLLLFFGTIAAILLTGFVEAL